jgi:hypothetical protein
MGQAGNQDQLFYSFNFDVHVPRGHLLRGVDRFTKWTTDSLHHESMPPQPAQPLRM